MKIVKLTAENVKKLRAVEITPRGFGRQRRAEADRLEEGAGHLEERANALTKKLAEAEALPDAVDVDALREALTLAEATNRQVAQRARKAELLAAAEQLEQEARALTATMEAREQAKAQAIAAAAMPVPGLGFGAGVVTFNGVPFDQASTAEQLRVSVAIAMAANPKLRVIRIKEGSLLDADNVQLLADLARAHDYQVWIERVDTSGKVGVVIEDGRVVAVDGEPAPEPVEAQA